MDLFAKTVPVLLPLPLDGPFHYIVDGPIPPPGSVVEVPFGRRSEFAVVWPEGAAPPPGTKLKAIGRVLDAPLLAPTLLALVDAVADATLQPRGAVLKLVLSTPAAFEPPVPRQGWALADDLDLNKGTTEARKRVLAAASTQAQTTAQLAKAAGVSGAVVRAAAGAGLLVQAALPEPVLAKPDPTIEGPTLSPAQALSATAIGDAVENRAQRCFLLRGVPGSGKTEVYFEGIARALEQGLQALILVPEIALTAQWLERFEARFGAPPVLWHSHLTATQRRRHWRAALTGEATVVIGARSAVFLPLRKLGLIVVDEEHDASFKQEDGVPYHGRDVALRRAALDGCPIVLASATPALESQVRACAIAGLAAAEPDFTLFDLPERHGGAALPEVRIVNLLRDKPPRGRWLSEPLIQAIHTALARGEQAMLFLNRRGYAPLLICRACGHRLRCPSCSAWLVWHRLRRRLLCHHCGYSPPEPEHCTACGAVETFAAAGPGVERIADEVASLFPDRSQALLTSDTTGSAKTTAESLKAIADGAVDIVIGTQLVAKGHHFPHLTMVGVVDADLGLLGGDLRAGERTFQLLYQVAGRAGREQIGGAAPGVVIVQSTEPSHPALQALAAGDASAFYAAEARDRAATGLPPFGALAALVVTSGDPERAESFAKAMVRAVPQIEGVRVLGPAPAPLALLRGRHRFRLLVQAPDLDVATSFVRRWLKGLEVRGDLRVHIDIDPQSFY